VSQRASARYVLDASIAMKWYLDDEQYSSQARAFLAGFREGQITLYAPDHIRYEVANALRNGVRRGRPSEQHGQEALDHFLAWRIPTVGSDALIRAGYTVASSLGCALYDELYVALAQNTGLQLLHADLRLHNTLAGRFSNELWIENHAG
jgi:predicted nucleic acid-binding protein